MGDMIVELNPSPEAPYMRAATSDDWVEYDRALRQPFDPGWVAFRLGAGNVAVPYIDVSAVTTRLTEVVGRANWAFGWAPVVIGAPATQKRSGKEVERPDNVILTARGLLWVAGVPHLDVGDGFDTEPNKASVSDAIKRCARQGFGVGDYLANLGVTFRTQYPTEYGQIDDRDVAYFRSCLPTPGAGDGWGRQSTTAAPLRLTLPPRPPEAQRGDRRAQDAQEPTQPRPAVNRPGSPQNGQPAPVGTPTPALRVVRAADRGAAVDQFRSYRRRLRMSDEQTDDMIRTAFSRQYPGLTGAQIFERLPVADVQRLVDGLQPAIDELGRRR